MLNHNISNLENSCRKLVDAFQNQLSWKWDDRFETVLAEFNVDDGESIFKTMKSHLGAVWTDTNSDIAPELIKVIINYFGGLNPGQQLFTSDSKDNDVVLCAWWPWGNGQNISIRIGVFSDSLSDEENEKLTLIFKGWFGL